MSTSRCFLNTFGAMFGATPLKMKKKSKSLRHCLHFFSDSGALSHIYLKYHFMPASVNSGPTLVMDSISADSRMSCKKTTFFIEFFFCISALPNVGFLGDMMSLWYQTFDPIGVVQVLMIHIHIMYFNFLFQTKVNLKVLDIIYYLKKTKLTLVWM